MEAFWMYARFQAMAFVMGIVGPIFLIIYFATQPDPTIKWMYYWGLVITAIDVLVALGLTQRAIADRTPVENRENESEEVT